MVSLSLKVMDAMFKIITKKLSKSEIVKDQHGFTLLELIIAMLLVSIIGIGLYKAFGTASKVTIVTRTQETAKDIAISDMESIESQPYAQNYILLTSTQNPSPINQSVTFTAIVTPNTAVGTVTFMDGATVLGTGTISSGTATYTTPIASPLALGNHSITAVYATNGTTSPVLTQVVASTVTTPSTTQTSQAYFTNLNVTPLRMNVYDDNEQEIDITVSLNGNTLFTLTDYRTNY